MACDAVAAADLAELFHRGDSAADLQLAAGDSEANDNADGNSETNAVERSVIAGDDAGFFKAVNTFGNRGSGKANFAAELGKRDAGVLLQGFEDLPSDSVELDSVRNCLMGHLQTIPKWDQFYA